MAIKITEQNRVIVVRRWKYSKERKRSLPTQVYSVSRYAVPDRLPDAVINDHSVDQEEQQTFIDFVSELNKEQDALRAKYSLRSLSDNLIEAKKALVDPDMRADLTLDQYEELSNTINDIKKLITKNKNAIKRKLTAKSTSKQGS